MDVQPVQPREGLQDAASNSSAIVGAEGTQKANAQPLSLVLPPRTATKGHWWIDILSDANGVNFHRFQMAAWTLVLGIVFVQDVYRGLAMPEFSVTLLGLLGISAGTYLGLKSTSE